MPFYCDPKSQKRGNYKLLPEISFDDEENLDLAVITNAKNLKIISQLQKFKSLIDLYGPKKIEIN